MKSFFKYMFATIFGILISFAILFLVTAGIIGAMVASTDKQEVAKPNTILKLKFDEPIPERTTENFFDDLNIYNMKVNTKIGLNDILMNIKYAKTDPNIKGIYLDVSILQAGWGTIEEIRNSLIDFKKSKKFVFAYSEMYTQKAYYLASAADSVFLNTQGELLLIGLRTEMMFYKGALEKLEVEPQIFRHGKYKSFVEPFTSDRMSTENKQQMTTLLNGLWGHIVLEISKSRKISVEELNTYANELTIRNPQSALKYKLIDGLKYKDQIIDILMRYTNVKSEKNLVVMGINKYNKVPKTNEKEGEKIALIYADGDINIGDGSNETIGADKMMKTIRDVRNDSSYKAIVLRINSPGGSALASDEIWRELSLAAKIKPVVVSMGDIAASGGYYIAAPAQCIVAEPTTITGSIGVFGMFFNFKKLFNNKLGITTDVVKTNTYADAGSLFRQVAPEEREALQAEVERTYDVFLTRVSDGRKMAKANADSIGQGRVWDAYSAKKIGLVDSIGGIDLAIQIAKSKAKLKKYYIVELPKQEDAFTTFMNDFMSSMKTKSLMEELGDNYYIYNNIKEILQYQGMQARIPSKIYVY